MHDQTTLWVEQVLFNDTIFHNIHYGRLSSTPEEVYDAARKAAIHDTIMNFPQQYSTLVGERGLKLSGGEKQRVALVRAFLKAPPILLCDEATSALDSTTEAEILTALRSLANNRTAVFVPNQIVRSLLIFKYIRNQAVHRLTQAKRNQVNRKPDMRIILI